jgi:tetratricopeptide (TPR) repeat protein
LLALACYWPCLRGGFVWDDAAHVTRPELQPAAGLWRIWSDLHATQQYYPLLHSAFWIEHRMWGDATLGYHLTNVLLHAAAAPLLVVALRHLNVRGAFLAGLVFTVHPVCVESVAWISEQKNTLSLVLYLLSALTYLRFEGSRGQPAGARAYFLASLLFAMALLTKTVTATLPAALLVVSWWRRGRLSWRRDVLPLLPWFVVAAASGLFTAWVERRIVGAEGSGFDLTLAQRCLLAGRVTWFYLGKILWPTHLSFVYPRWDAGSEAGGWAGYLAAAVLLTAALALLARRRRGPLAAWLFFVGSLFPALGFLNVFPFLFSYVADHFQYLASIGIITAASAGTARLLGRTTSSVRRCGWGLAAAGVGVLAVLSNAQSRTYADAPTLYRATLAQNPGSWLAHNNLGVWEEGRGELGNAAAEYAQAIRLRGGYEEAQANLGGVLMKLGRLDEATPHLREALRLRPDVVGAHEDLANALSRTPGGLDEAVLQYREALRMDPGFAAGHNNLGNTLLGTPATLDQAAAQFEEALRLDPGYAEAHNNLGIALGAQGRRDEAVAQYREALRLKPDFAEIHFNIAMALLNRPGKSGEAEAELEAFLRVRPGDEAARRILGELRASRR